MNHTSLARLLHPRTVAVVGASESLAMSNNAVRPMLAAGIDVQLVNPRRDEAYGRPCLPSLAAIGAPVDAVLSLVNAERSVATVREAAELGCGGVVLAAAGFGEAGESGRALQKEVESIAADSGLAVVGPNCSGFINARDRINLFTGGAITPRPGRLAIVSQSGFLVRSTLAAAGRRQVGVSVAVSSGNEAVCGLHDYVQVFAEDPDTSVICLVVEKIRDPARFFAAVRDARDNHTAVIALKLGRTDSARSIIASHTGAIADAAWVYDLALAEHGVIGARDIDELVDRAQLFEQLPRPRWAPMRRAALLTSSGGVSALATDVATTTTVELPPMTDVAPWVRETIPGADTVNPLDMTGFVVTDRAVLGELFTRYSGADSIDLLGLCWWVGPGDADWGRLLLEPFATVAETSRTPCVVTSLEDAAVGEWTAQWRDRGLAVTAGVRSLYRAMEAMTAFVTYAGDAVTPDEAGHGGSPSARRGRRHALDGTAPGGLVGFATAMGLLESCGVPVAPYLLIGPGEAVPPLPQRLGERLVVKLADVPHRTELGAVALDVPPERLTAEVARLRALAAAAGVPATVAVQAQVEGIGEAFLGLQTGTDLGSILLFGRGGILVETSGQVTGRMLPLGPQAAPALVEQVAGDDVIGRFRGQSPWPQQPLVDAVIAVERLWQTLGGAAASVDLNPLVVTADGVVAVDALLIAASD